MKIATIVGARPNFVKLALLHKTMMKEFDCVLIHTGQHYDYDMSEAFFKEFSIPKPDYNLGIGSFPRGEQIGKMLIELEWILKEVSPKLVMVLGDVNSALAGALSAKILNLPLAHIEAGVRYNDMSQPEELNRVIVDRISNLNLCPTPTAASNLDLEGTDGIFTGDIMLDNFLHYSSDSWHQSAPLAKQFIYVTVHRAENTDNKERLQHIATALNKLSKKQTIVFPLHPRTKKMLEQFHLKLEFDVIEPIEYHQSLNFLQSASLVITDSGGLQKEAYFAGTPCITLDKNTPWPETLRSEANILISNLTCDNILNIATMRRVPFRPILSLFGNGKAVENTMILLRSLNA